MKNKNYPLSLNIQPMDGITYKEAMLTLFAVAQDLEKVLGKPMEEITSGTYDYKLLQNTSVQIQVKKTILKVYVFRTEKYIFD